MGIGHSTHSTERLLVNNNKRSSRPMYHPNSSDDSINILDEGQTNEKREQDYSEKDSDLSRCFNEQDHMSRQGIHYGLKKMLFQCEFSSPVKDKLSKGGKVLDLGCGAACFLLDVAGRYPNSKFIGVDIEPVYPKETELEECGYNNLKFIKADMFKKLPFPDNEFDLVNVGSIVFSITRDQLDFLIKEMIRVCKPNGYIEFDETHMTHESRGVGERFGQLLRGFALVANSYGADNNTALRLPGLLSNPNTASVDVVNRKITLGPNGGNLGRMLQHVFEWFNNSSEKFVDDCCKQLHITKEQYNQLVEDAAKEQKYSFPEATLMRVYAQKKLIN